MVIDIVGKFAKVVSDKYGEYGLEQGSTVFIAGSGFSPIDDEDNYKLLFVASLVVDGVPSTERGVTIARTSLEVLSDEENEALKTKMDEAFAKDIPKGGDVVSITSKKPK